MIDLARFDTATGSEEGRWIEPVDLSGKKIGMKVLVYGPDSKKYGQAKDEVQREMYAMLADVQTGLVPKSKGLTDAEKEAVFYAKVTGAWEPIGKEKLSWNGEPFPFTYENAVKLYTLVPAIKNQVKLFCESRRNFTKPESAD